MLRCIFNCMQYPHLLKVRFVMLALVVTVLIDCRQRHDYETSS